MGAEPPGLTPAQQRAFQAAEKRAASYAQDPNRVARLLADAEHKAEAHSGRLALIWKDLHALFRLIHAWFSGDYRVVPWKAILWALAAVIYFVNPFDLIPDLIPFAGFPDDATMIGFVIRAIRSDLDKFLAWENTPSS